jgi:uncharacterized protein YbaA (DUF1428 family)
VKGYVDLYILPIRKKNLAAYRKLARRYGKIIEEHGALECREWVGNDLKVKGGITPFTSKIKLRPGEVLISSVVEFRSKSHRNQVNKKVMNDPRMKRLMAEPMDGPIMDMKRMLYGGFFTIVKM